MSAQPVVIVTGGAGYVGSHAAQALAAAGFLPVTLDNLDRGHRALVRFGPLVELELADEAAVRAALAQWQPVGVMHFAALAYVGESVSEPYRYYRNNVGATLSLLAAMRAHDPGLPLVFSSTCAVYGDPEFLPLTEAHRKQPVNPYGQSKWMVEQVLADARQAYGLRCVALRYFNACGALAEHGIGEWHEPETHLLPLLIESALGRRGPVQVFGDDWPTADGSCVRDYIHVADLADAHLKALERLRAGTALAPAYNLGTGVGHSVRECIASVERVTGRPVPVVAAARRPGDPAALVADAAAARSELGWQPRWTDLDAVVASALRWHQREAGG
jgi:UDP-arabinose 4-epimerase